MMKKLTLLAMAVAALTMFAMPAVSQATTTEWIKSGATLKTNDQVHFQGPTGFNGAIFGTVDCPTTTATITLTAGGHNGVVNSFAAINPSTCDFAGFIGSTCGTNPLTSTGLVGTPTVTGTNAGTGIAHVSGITLKMVFGTCLTIHMTGGLTATFDSKTAAKTATLSGTLKDSLGGNVTVTGDLSITAGQSGIYGIATF